MVKRSTALANDLDAAFSALADPTRRAILARLASSQRRVGELARPLTISAPAVSRHLRILEAAGLVSRRKVGRTHVLRLVPQALDPARDWIERHRKFWSSKLDSLERYLADANRKETPWPTSSTASRSPRRRRRSSP